MLGKVYYNGKEKVIKFSPKTKDNEFDKVKNAAKAYFEEEFGEECRLEISSMTVYNNDGDLSNYKQLKGTQEVKHGKNSSLIGASTLKEDSEHEYPELTLVTSNGRQEVKVGVDLFEKGFVLSTNKIGSGFLGSTYTQYYNKITRGTRYNRIYTSKKVAAKKFKTLQAVIKELEKQERLLKSFAKSNGYNYSLEYASNFFEEVYKKSLEENKKKALKHDEQIAQIRELLSDINDIQDESPHYIYGKTQLEEAVIRMKELDLSEKLINQFEKHKKVFVSDLGGAWFELDENARQLVNAIEKTGNLVYHVLRTGPMYSALFVSANKDYWEEERYDKRTNLIYSYATMGQGGYGSFEGGDIQVVPVAGGLSRIG